MVIVALVNPGRSVTMFGGVSTQPHLAHAMTKQRFGTTGVRGRIKNPPQAASPPHRDRLHGVKWRKRLGGVNASWRRPSYGEGGS